MGDGQRHGEDGVVGIVVASSWWRRDDDSDDEHRPPWQPVPPLQ
jgi:hypothetical protein